MRINCETHTQLVNNWQLSSSLAQTVINQSICCTIPLGLAISAPFAAVLALPAIGHVQQLSFPLPGCPSLPTGDGSIDTGRYINMYKQMSPGNIKVAIDKMVHACNSWINTCKQSHMQKCTHT